AKAFEAAGEQANATTFYRRTYFFGAGSDAAKEAEAKLTSLGQPLIAANAEEALARAERFLRARNYVEADKAYAELAARYPAALTPATNLYRLIAAANSKKMPEAQNAFNAIPVSSPEKEKAY